MDARTSGLPAPLMWVLAILVAALVGFAMVMVVRYLRQRSLRHDFCSRFGIEPTRAIRLKRRQTRAQESTYQLAFPRWARSNRDGSHDDRSDDRGVRWGICRLEVDSYELTCRDPRIMADLVADLRGRGAVINPCEPEKVKMQRLAQEAARTATLRSVESIHAAFADDPTGFERLVAKLYRKRGFECEVTPPSRDGGYDVACKVDGRLDAIVECKCFSAGNVVGRPLIQKLVGANQGTDGARAPHMAFVTTSRFSQEAVTYAAETGVTLVDGTALLSMLDEAGLLANKDEAVAGMAADGWQLTHDDLMRWYPPDWFDAVDRG